MAAACANGFTDYFSPASSSGAAFSTNPDGAYADGGGAAEAENGRGLARRYGDFAIVVPEGCPILGLEVRADWWLDSAESKSSITVSLTSDRGQTWTDQEEDTNQTTSPANAALLGGPSDLWGGSWTADNLGDSDFQVRVITKSDSIERDFFLDWIAVRIYYGDEAVPTPTPPPIDTSYPVFVETSVSAKLPQTSTNSWGVVWMDYDNDGWVDFYYGRHQGKKASLYHNLGNGTFQDVGVPSGLQSQQDRHGCTAADFNRDTRIDLICTGDVEAGQRNRVWRPRLWLNNGNGTFMDVAESYGLVPQNDLERGRSATWIDYDHDGDLDLVHAGNYVRNLLFRSNYPAQTFTNIPSPASGLAGFANKLTRTVSSVDYDNDGCWDIFEGAKRLPRMTTQQVFLYHGNKTNGQCNGTFTDVAVQAGIIVDSAHSGAWGDYDNDGCMDLFVGGWIEPDVLEPQKLYHNLCNGSFQDVTSSAGIFAPNTPSPSDPDAARMGVWGDYNNDGLTDLFVVNGQDAAAAVNVPDQLYMNDGDGTFTEVAALSGIQGPSTGSGDGAAWADYNRDGFLDIAVGNGAGWAPCVFGSTPPCQGPLKLYRNTPNGNHWLTLHLHATKDYYGVGSSVTLSSGSTTQRRQVTDGAAGSSQNQQVVHFGLGAAQHVDSLLVKWPDGSQTVLSNLDVSAGQVDAECDLTQGASALVCTTP
jgi:hypothetical protein